MVWSDNKYNMVLVCLQDIDAAIVCSAFTDRNTRMSGFQHQFCTRIMDKLEAHPIFKLFIEVKLANLDALLSRALARHERAFRPRRRAPEARER